MPALGQIKGRDGKHEDRAADIARTDGVYELGLSHCVENNRHKVRDFHAHGIGIELGADRVLHPAIGHENPEGREIGAQRHQPGDDQMADLAQPVPTKEEQADKSGFEEERHQAFNRQRRAEHVAYIVTVVTPVHAELEFHDNAGSDAHGEINAEQRRPEHGRLAPDIAARHHIDAFHDGHHD